MKKKNIVTRTLIILVAGIFVYAYAVHPLVANRQGLAAVDETEKQHPVGPAFNADSAYRLCAEQCAFGPRIMNSQAHDQCREWIVGKFQAYGLDVVQQQADLVGYDGTTLKATNIIAHYRPEAERRIIVAAHWDCRPWADNDPDEANHHKPVMAANDAASGVAVMIELARLLATDSAAIGIDFICFDAEDWGTPQWSDLPDDPQSWALGAQYWANHPQRPTVLPSDSPATPPTSKSLSQVEGAGSSPSGRLGGAPMYGILLDMVGGRGGRFYQEAYSKAYAPNVVRKVWRAAQTVGKSTFFPKRSGGQITDDHVPMNQVARIPTIDIIPYYPDCPQSSFGPTWHTVSDTMENIDPLTLEAVGQTLVQVIYSEP